MQPLHACDDMIKIPGIKQDASWMCRYTYPHGYFAFSELSLEGFGMHSEVLHVRESLFYLTLVCRMHQQGDLECDAGLWRDPSSEVLQHLASNEFYLPNSFYLSNRVDASDLESSCNGAASSSFYYSLVMSTYEVIGLRIIDSHHTHQNHDC